MHIECRSMRDRIAISNDICHARQQIHTDRTRGSREIDDYCDDDDDDDGGALLNIKQYSIVTLE